MPPKPKRLPPPSLLHLKHSRQLLEDFLYQYLPSLTGMSALSRLNLWAWYSSKWALTPDAKGGIPYMVLEALRQQRQYLLSQKRSLKPLSLSLISPPQDILAPKALPLLEELNKRSHTATLTASSGSWQAVLPQLQAQLQRQPAAERNLLLLDPLDIALPPLPELLAKLPKRLDVLLVLPLAAVQQAAGLYSGKTPPHEAAQGLARWLSPLLPQPETEVPEELTPEKILAQLRQGLMEGAGHFAMLQQQSASPVLLLGLSHDALMMEKMLQARQRLAQKSLQQEESGDQLGLFAHASSNTASLAADLTEPLLALLARQPEWSNQELYTCLLQHEILPQQAIPPLLGLIEAGSLALLDEKKKKAKPNGALPLNHTAYKLPAASRFFRLKG
jgi:hypothetical protein